MSAHKIVCSKILSILLPSHLLECFEIEPDIEKLCNIVCSTFIKPYISYIVVNQVLLLYVI